MKAAKLVMAVAVGAAVVGAAAAWGCASKTAAGGPPAAARTPAPVEDTETEAAAPSGPKTRYVAVVETEVDAQSGASAELNPAEVRQITAALRREAVENLPRGTYNIMTSETVQSMGGAVLEECSDENCVVTLGSKIGADYIVRGVISKFGAKFTLSVEMYETDNGMLVASSEYVRADNTAELMDKAMAASANMYRKFVNPQGAAAPRQEQQAVATPVVPTPQSVNNEAAPTYQPSGVDGSGTLTDNRDGKKYKTAVIGGKRWLAENLNYKPQSGYSWCYDKVDSNCDRYGRLYIWSTALTVCPWGWHLPAGKEWDNMTKSIGGPGEGKRLKARTGWVRHGNGTDDYGFSALPGGLRGPDGDFDYIGKSGSWWTATEGGNSNAYFRDLDETVGEGYGSEYLGLSVRCVAD